MCAFWVTIYHEGYLYLHIPSGPIYISQNVFSESSFPFSELIFASPPPTKYHFVNRPSNLSTKLTDQLIVTMHRWLQRLSSTT